MPAKPTLTPERKLQIDELMALEMEGSLSEVISRLHALLQEYPDDFYLRYHLAQVFVRHSHPNDALRAAREFEAAYPENRNGPLLVAKASIRALNFDEALGHIDRAESLGGPSARTRKLRIQVLSRLGRLSEAQAIVQEEQSTEPVGLDALWAREAVNGATTEAEMRRTVERLRTLREHPSMVASYAARWFVRQGDLDRAVEEYERGIDLSPESEGLKLELAMLQWKRGNAAAATAILSELFARNPVDAKIAGHLTDLLKRRGKHLRAIHVAWTHSCAYARARKRV